MITVTEIVLEGAPGAEVLGEQLADVLFRVTEYLAANSISDAV